MWSEGHSVMSTSLWPLCSPWNSPGQNTGMGSLSLLQGIFPTPGSNPDLPHCRWIPYQLSHQGSPARNEASLKIHKERVQGTSPLVNKWSCWRVGGNPVMPWKLCTSSYIPSPIHLFCLAISELYLFICCCCSVAKSCLTPCNLWTAAHQASLSFTIRSWPNHVQWINDAIQPSHPIIIISNRVTNCFPEFCEPL